MVVTVVTEPPELDALICTDPVAELTVMLEPATILVTPALLRVTELPSCALPPPLKPDPAVIVTELLVS